MICPVTIAHKFLTLVEDKFTKVSPTDSSQSNSQLLSQEANESELAERLFKIFESLLTTPLIEEETLDFESLQDYYESDYVNHESQELETSSDCDEDAEKSSYDVSDFDLQYMKKVVEFAKSHKFAAIKNRFKKVLYPHYITRFQKYVKHAGTRLLKVRQLDKNVYARFTKARNKHLPVHDADLKRWAIQESQILKFSNFKCSDSWILPFKTRNRLCSRKIPAP